MVLAFARFAIVRRLPVPIVLSLVGMSAQDGMLAQAGGAGRLAERHQRSRPLRRGHDRRELARQVRREHVAERASP